MYATVRVNGDAVSWVVSVADIAATARQIAESSAPVVLAALGPAAGRLILSPRAASTVTLLPPPAGGDVIPSHSDISAARIYLPCDTQRANSLPGYALAAGTDLGQLEDSITDAMQNSAVTTAGLLVPTSVEGPGFAILNGASLPYAVIIPPSRP